MSVNKSTIELAAMLGLTIEVNLVPFQQNVPDQLLNNNGDPAFLTIHDTANTAVGADARMHRNFVASGGGPDFASFTYAVDDKRAVQILKEDHVNYAQGGTPNTGNHVSLSIETCIASDENWAVTLDNLAKLAACITVRLGRDISWIVQHNYWWGKDCPGKIRHTQGGWAALLVAISGYITTLNTLLSAPPPAPEQPLFVPPSTYPIIGGFKTFYQAHPDALTLFGLPLNAEHAQTIGTWSGTVQDFERARFEWHTESGAGVVQLGLVNAELLAKG